MLQPGEPLPAAVDWTALAAFGEHLIAPLARRFNLRREDAADCVADALLALWEHRADLRPPATGYLARTAYRKAIDLTRRSWRRRALTFTDCCWPDDDGALTAPDWPDPAAGLEAAVVRELERTALVTAVNAVLADLPPTLVLVLRTGYGDEEGLAALARRLDVPIGTMASRARRARRQFVRVWRERYGNLEVPHATDDRRPALAG